MMKKNYIEIALILDRSGSMQSLRQDAVKGLNEFISKQKLQLVGKQVKFSLILFDHQYLKPIDSQNLWDIKEFTQSDYQPRGLTALLDAIGQTTDDLGQKFEKQNQNQKPEKVIIAIITDGLENNSQRYDKNKIKEMISRQQKEYNWSFIFLSSDLTSIENAKIQYGIDPNMVYCFNASQDGYIGANSSYSKLSKAINTSINTTCILEDQDDNN